jgi:glutaredoxin
MTATRPTSSLVQVYGTDKCKETESVRRELNREKIAFEYVDVRRDIDAAKWIRSLTNGFLVTPVLDFYGEVLIQPSQSKLDLVLRAVNLPSRV